MEPGRRSLSSWNNFSFKASTNRGREAVWFVSVVCAGFRRYHHKANKIAANTAAGPARTSHNAGEESAGALVGALVAVPPRLLPTAGIAEICGAAALATDVVGCGAAGPDISNAAICPTPDLATTFS